jgi:hypothetical protein
MLTIGEESNSATANLAAGTYHVYAVGSDDLSRYSLPSQEEASATSAVTLQQGKVLGDLLLSPEASVTLTDGETRQLNLSLERMVFCVSTVTIKKVPADVTKVEVALEPLYNSVLLNGTYPNETTSYRVTLAEDANESGTWQAAPLQMQYPSKGKPTITVYFTRSNGVKSYSYTASEQLEANHHLTIEGTYSEPLGVTLQGIVSGTEWGEDKTIVFSFDESSATGQTGNEGNGQGNEQGGEQGGSSDTPVVGQTYKGCYVVAVDGNTATLLSPTEKTRFTNSSNIPQEIETALASWPNVDGVTGTWRLPTLDEAKVFLLQFNLLNSQNASYSYSVTDKGVLKRFTVNVNYATGEFYAGSVEETLTLNMHMRPVIDITL